MNALMRCPHCETSLTLEQVDRLVDGTLAEIVDDALDVRDAFRAARVVKALN